MIDKNPYLKSNILLKNFKKNRSINQLSKKFEKIFLDIKKEINQDNKTLNILNSKFKFNFKTKDLNKFKKFKNIVLIGMGGSILGAEAIHSFFKEKIKKKVYFFNNLDEDKIANLKKNGNLSKFLFIIISKSGNTIETLSNTFYLNIIKNNAKNIILISEKKNNHLFSLSKKFNLFYVEHKNFIGGRFSVLSDAGVLPAYLMGINIKRLRSKIFDCLKKKNKTSLKNNVIKLAILNDSKKYNNLIFLNYSRELEKFLYWSQQLIAESLGKKSKGFLPVISNVPKDHHSLLQLYLDGPKDKIFYIFHIEKKLKEKININKNLKIKSFLNKKKLHVIKNAQRLALMKSLIKRKIPLREFQIKNANEETLGKLFTYFIIETIILGRLLNINPFNQPAVEQVKVNTKKLLS
mgnify:CR=1 FL=1